MSTRLIAAAGFAVVLASASAAFAQDADADARRAFRLAQAHYDNGEFEQAAVGFEEAYRLSQRPQLLYNMYVAYRDAQNVQRAADALQRYLDQVPDAPDRDQLRSRLERMQAALTSQGQSATIEREEGESGLDTGAMGPEETGDPGGTSDTGASTAAADTSGTTDTGTGTEMSASTDGLVDEAGGSSLPVPALVVGGVGAALIVGSVITGIMTSSKQSELEDGCPTRVGCDPALEDTRDSGQTLAVVTDVLLFTGLAAVGAGVAMFFLMQDEPSDSPTASVGCGPGGCMGSLRVGF
jgi:tetratricopeptide (TPR) repeat protein